MRDSQAKMIHVDCSDQVQAEEVIPKDTDNQPHKKATKTIYIVFLVLFLIYTAEFILFYISSRSQYNQLQNLANFLKTQLEQHERQSNLVRQFDEKILDSAQKQERQTFFLKKVQIIKKIHNSSNFLQYNQKAKTSFYLALNNFKLVHQNVILTRQISKVLQNEYDRLSKIYDFTLPEEPFCVVAPTMNNVQNYRSEYHLRSILNQNYTNFKVVIIDDASIDHSFEILTQFIKNNPVSQQIFLLKNQERKMATANLFKAATEYCKPEDIMVIVDGDDQLLGVNIFKVFNSLYIIDKLEVIYSNYIRFSNLSIVYQGISRGYTQEEKKLNMYRNESYTRVFPLRSFRVRNFLKIQASDLQTKEGVWFKSASDHAIFTPLLELSCGKNKYIDEYFYLYNDGNGNNDLDVDPEMNTLVNQYVRFQLPKHECDPN